VKFNNSSNRNNISNNNNFRDISPSPFINGNVNKLNSNMNYNSNLTNREIYSNSNNGNLRTSNIQPPNKINK
jgi:hypothetical protein